MAVVISRAIVAVEVAVEFARAIPLPEEPAVKVILGIVTDTHAFRICAVNHAVRVIIQAISARVDLSVAARYFTRPRSGDACSAVHPCSTTILRSVSRELVVTEFERTFASYEAQESDQCRTPWILARVIGHRQLPFSVCSIFD